jgi:hypothetical protein
MAVALVVGMRPFLRFTTTRLAALALAGTLMTAACGDENDDAGPGGAATRDVAMDTDTADIFLADEASTDDRPAVVYPDLTRYDWYARGEPLVHEGRAFVAGGPLVAAPASAMEHAGEYGGVAYFREGGGNDSTLYVPVYARYWLAFRARDSVPAN